MGDRLPITGVFTKPEKMPDDEWEGLLELFHLRVIILAERMVYEERALIRASGQECILEWKKDFDGKKSVRWSIKFRAVSKGDGA